MYAPFSLRAAHTVSMLQMWTLKNRRENTSEMPSDSLAMVAKRGEPSTGTAIGPYASIPDDTRLSTSALELLSSATVPPR